VTPGDAANSRRHRRGQYSVAEGQFVGVVSVGKERSSLFDDLFGELGGTASRALGLGPVGYSIESVVQGGAHPQVVRVDVQRDVVFVEDVQAFRNGSMEHLERNPVSQVGSLGVGDLAVLPRSRPSPEPRSVHRWRVFWHDKAKDSEQVEALLSSSSNGSASFGISIGEFSSVVSGTEALCSVGSSAVDDGAEIRPNAPVANGSVCTGIAALSPSAVVSGAPSSTKLSGERTALNGTFFHGGILAHV
jgi:hypothetical protein